ncbi:MAG: hypothetical protein J07HQX50_02649 [Haloquadratum sp. J07HQX50]|nr:MAG: hypothetical protein J07HQX50_02649 [Haloquadratum sp. J07HQX50]
MGFENYDTGCAFFEFDSLLYSTPVTQRGVGDDRAMRSPSGSI